MIEAIQGNWWLDEGESSGVWPCEVLSANVFGVRVRTTHEGSMYYGDEIVVPHNRVYDSGFHHVRETFNREDQP
jgi:hypothetical protein